MLKNTAYCTAGVSAFIGSIFVVDVAVAGPKITMTKRDCQRLVRHQARSDVAFKPGVDVRGKKVKSADLHGRPKLKIPDVITFDVKFDIKQFLGKPEADAKAASTAAIAADKAKSAATTAATAATSAEAAATTAQTVATAAKATSDAATAAFTAAQTAKDADPTNQTLIDALNSAETTAETALSAYTSAQSDADAISASAVSARSAATLASSAASAESKATYAQQAADAATTAASTAQTSAGSDASKAALLTAGNTAATDATAASTAASVSSTANTDNIAAYRAAAKVGDNLGDGVIGKVKYSISSGKLTFNGQPLDAGNEKELARQCKAILNQ